MRVPISPDPHQLYLFIYKIIAILVSMKWYLIVVLISLIANNFEHVFMSILAICISCLRNMNLNPLPFIGYVNSLFIVEL